MGVVDTAEPQFLFDRACELLTAAEDCLTSKDIDLPVHRYVSACEPDLACCDTLAVYPTIIAPIYQDRDRTGCAFLRELHFELWVTRCVTVFTRDGRLPVTGNCVDQTPGTVTGDAAIVLADRWALMICLMSSLCALAAATDPHPPWQCNKLKFVGVRPICEANCAGTVFEIALSV